MRKVLQVLVVCAVIAAVVLGIVIHGNVQQEKQYQEAVHLMQNYRYEAAEAAFLELDGYQDSAEKATQMEKLTKINKTEVLKLFPEHQGAIQYWCQEAFIGMRIYWDLDCGKDLYAQWAAFYPSDCNISLSEQFFGEMIGRSYLIRYDPDTEEYFFTRSGGDVTSGNLGSSTKIQFRGRLNEDGSLDLYNDNGDRYTFLLYSNDEINNGTLAE